MVNEFCVNWMMSAMIIRLSSISLNLEAIKQQVTANKSGVNLSFFVFLSIAEWIRGLEPRDVFLL